MMAPARSLVIVQASLDPIWVAIVFSLRRSQLARRVSWPKHQSVAHNCDSLTIYDEVHLPPIASKMFLLHTYQIRASQKDGAMLKALHAISKPCKCKLS